MNNKNKKNYKKVYLNGKCIIDFTQQTVNENNVTSGNMFFDTEGNLIEGKDDSSLLLRGMFGGIDYSDPCVKDYLNVSALTCLGSMSTMSSCIYSSFFPWVQYIKVNNISSIGNSGSDWSCYSDFQKSWYLASAKVAENLKSSFYKALINNAYSDSFRGQIFCEDDLSKYDLPEYDTDLIISNCSDIKTTDDGAFNYVISNNKVYLLGLNHEASYTTAAYDDILIYDETSEREGWSFKFPDTIEGLPVVSIGSGIFGYTVSTNYGSNMNINLNRYTSSCIKMELPKNLEIIGVNCFSSFSRDTWSSGGSNLPGIKLPATLRRIHYYSGNNSWSSAESFEWVDERFFTEEDSLPLPDADLSSSMLYTISSCLSSQGCNLEYLPSVSSSNAYYLGGNSNITDIVIAEGCRGALSIPSNATSVSFPSTIKVLPRMSNRSSLLSINFAETIEAAEIPSSFAYGCSAITSISIPEGVKKIGNASFRGCKITDITLPTTLTYISDYVFYEPSGTAAKTIKVKAQTPPTIQHNDGIANNKSTGIAKIIVPQGCLNKYKTASNWSTWASKMEESKEW
jgi:hypothetical protein